MHKTCTLISISCLQLSHTFTGLCFHLCHKMGRPPGKSGEVEIVLLTIHAQLVGSYPR